jgi:hypothetical protein
LHGWTQHSPKGGAFYAYVLASWVLKPIKAPSFGLD